MALPATMFAIEIARPGGPEVLQITERSVPQPGLDEVLIKVAASGVNRPDIMQRLGHYPPPPGASEIPGLEVAGEIVAIGPGATRFHIGDSVCALLSGGGYAEYVPAPEVQCLPLPHGLDFISGAAIPETFFTVWTNVFDRGRLSRGETLLVHGGASGIGTTAIQLANARGSRVFATARSAEKCAACEQLGAERAINSTCEDFVQRIREATDGRGADVILDMVGGDFFQKNLEVLALEGRLVQIASLKGTKVELSIRELMQKRLTVTGSTLRSRTPAEKGMIAQALEREVWPLLKSGKVKPLIHAVFDWREAAAAHALMESNRHIGKLVLRWR